MTVVDASLAADDEQLPLEQEVACLIVETLQIEVAPADIHPCSALFVEGLGLDSIDALELALAISRQYGFDMKSDDAGKLEIFASLRNLSAHVARCRTR